MSACTSSTPSTESSNTRRQAKQRRDRPVQPERVAVDDEERVGAQDGQGSPHAAAGFQQVLLPQQDSVGRRRPLRQMRRDRVGLPVGVDRDGFHAGIDQMVQRVVQQRASAQHQQRLGGGVGQAAACGSPGRRPEPWRNAAITVMLLQSWRVAARGSRDPAVQGGGQRFGGWLGQGIVQQPPRSRPVGEVLRPAVAQGKPYPLAGDPKMPLRRTGGECGAECAPHPVRGGRRDTGPARGCAGRLGNVAAGVLQQRNQVVGRMANGGALEVDDPDPMVRAAGASCRRSSRDGQSRPGRRRPVRSMVASAAATSSRAASGAACAESGRPPPVEQRAERGGGHHRGIPCRQTFGRGARCMTTSASTAASSSGSGGSP